MSRLVVVSNRVAEFDKASQSGGLAVALADALKTRGGVWFGWDGKVVGAGTRVPPTVKQYGNVQSITLPLTRKDYNEFYVGFANSVLWPILHYRLDLAQHQASFLTGYKRVNSKFADALSSLLKPDDIIWIHDYHLIPLASELRKRGHRHPMGFFLHIPFPPYDIFSATPAYKWLGEALLDYDLCGFQTTTDHNNFQQFVETEFPDLARAGDVSYRKSGRVSRSGSYPIGIDVEAFRKMAHSKESDERIAFLQRRTTARNHIIGVDRLDYSKGLPDRMRAFRRLLQKYPEMLKRVTLMQIAPPTRENVEAYSDIREELEGLSGAVNGEFADFDWTPLRYIHRAIPRNILAALLRGSEVGFVTPLRDGMNLVAKEYVAAQSDDNPGVLVLSKFAGAAEEMAEALIVNPYDTDEMAATLYEALNLPLSERIDRQKALLARIRRNDAKFWQSSFLDALTKPHRVP
ncbi:MAG: trehalose-6-phosphate synthase [Hyphomicrobiaceae bacterium]|nr:trehalose-6-phosphate synthase [Hyphomicrobiaceae bacterium]